MSKTDQHIAVHGLIEKDGKYLLVHRSEFEDYKPGEWDIPGGAIDLEDGDPITTLNREIFEETGLITKVGKIIYLFYEIQNASRQQFQAIYECEFVKGEVKLDLHEHSEYKWVTVQEMREYKIMNFVKSLVENVL